MGHHVGQSGHAVNDLAIIVADQIKVVAGGPAGRRKRRAIGSDRDGVQLAVVAWSRWWPENREQRPTADIPDPGGLVPVSYTHLDVYKRQQFG